MPFEHDIDDSGDKIKTKRKPIGKKARFEVFKRDSFTCQYCGVKAPDAILHVDHIDPVANGGGNDLLNLITSCEGCNLGKGARSLSDHTEIAKQREQLEEINQRREQLEAMLKWREELMAHDEDALATACEIWDAHIHPCSINDTGIAEFKKLGRKFGYELLIQAIDKAVDRYVKHEDGGAEIDSVNFAFSKLGGICYFLKNPEKCDQDKDIFYVRGILRNRLDYVNQKMCVRMLRDAVACDICMDSVKEFAKNVRNWTDFRDAIEGYIQGRSDG